VSLRLKPGDPISEKEVAARYGVSRTPVREAIQRLADERLVEIFPQSGTFVARIPYGDLPEAMVIRKALETASVRLATEKATRSQLLALATIVEQQREAAEANDRGAFHRADEAFHAKIAEISGFPGIWRQVLQVKVQVDRYRRLTLSQEGRMAQVIADHERILAGITAGNPQDAEIGMALHLDAVLPDTVEGKPTDGTTD
jgi:DNA-binding GntR family transcriptional regulator